MISSVLAFLSVESAAHAAQSGTTPDLSSIDPLIAALTIPVILVGIVALWLWVSGLANIRDDEVGIKIRKVFGKQMPQGQIIARKPSDVGIQADTLMPRLYWFNPITWKIKKTKITVIPPGSLGVVEAIDGQELPHGRLLGDRVECNSYQNGKAFLDGGGKRGPQVEILRPGSYRINTELFIVNSVSSVVIPQEQIGVVIARDGKPLPPGLMIAPKPEEKEGKSHKFFQDAQAFIDLGGYRGPQLDTLQPGAYYINPIAFEVKAMPIADVPPGYVAVLRSNIGEELVKEETKLEPPENPSALNQSIHEPEEVVLTTDKNQRGIWREPVAPGKYNLNPLAFTAYLVPTSAVTIDWASGAELRVEHTGPVGATLDTKVKGVDQALRASDKESEKAREFFRFSQLRVTSKDGFQLEVDVRMIIRIHPQHAAYVIARFGTVTNLIEQIVHPLIDSSFRNKAGEKKAIDFIMSRTLLQEEALEKAQIEFKKYHVEAQGLLIAYINVDQALLETQTKKEIAAQQQTQYEQEALAQQKLIAVREQEARAGKQKEVVDAVLSIQIAKNRADALREEAAGIRDKTMKEADGTAYKNKMEGLGVADALQAQASVLGPQVLGAIRSLVQISLGHVNVVPEVLVTGGAGADLGAGNLVTTLLATMLLKEGKITTPPKEENKRFPPKDFLQSSPPNKTDPPSQPSKN